MKTKKVIITEEEHKKFLQALATLEEKQKEKEKEEVYYHCKECLFDYIMGNKYEFWPNEVKKIIRQRFRGEQLMILIDENKRIHGA